MADAIGKRSFCKIGSLAGQSRELDKGRIVAANSQAFPETGITRCGRELCVLAHRPANFLQVSACRSVVLRESSACVGNFARRRQTWLSSHDAISVKLFPVSSWMAFSPVKFCHRRMARLTYRGSISIPQQMRPTRSAAKTVLPEPKKESRTISPRAEQSSNASAIMAMGFTVGCMARTLPPTSPQRESELAPG